VEVWLPVTKQLDCIVDGCDATTEAETEEGVMAQAEAHAQDAHPDVTLDEETAATIRSNIRDV
jgi:predicted small metal-binding protein